MARHSCLGDARVAHEHFTLHAHGGLAPGFHFDLDAQLVAGQHGPSEPCALDSGEHHQLVTAVFHFGKQKRAPGLGNGLDDQHPRHNGHFGEVSSEERLVNGDVLDGYDALLAGEINDTVNQEEGMAMGQDAQDVANIQRNLGRRRRSFRHRVSAVSHSAPRKCQDYTVLRTQRPSQSACLRELRTFMMKRKSGSKQIPVPPAKAGTVSLAHFQKQQSAMVETIRQMVEIESPSDNKQAVDRLGHWLAGKFEALGGHSKFHRTADFGDHLQVDFPGKDRRKPVLLLGHIDTVYPVGTLATMPCRVGEGRLWGPGALDMKSGIAAMLYAIDALRDQGGTLPRAVNVLLVSDEEVGSNSSRRITEEVAKRSAAVLVLEPSYGSQGALKTARKGVGEYLLKVSGKASHAGLDFEKGESAVLELARQIERISAMTDLKRGLTVSVGLVSGGTRVNVVPSEARASIDVRIARLSDAGGIDRKLRRLKPVNRKCKLEIKGGIDRPPLERTAAVADLFRMATGLAKELGWKLEEASVGGGSDGNLTAALGIPTLDGLGGVGEGAHAPHESILISELPRRTALLAGLIETV